MENGDTAAGGNNQGILMNGYQTASMDVLLPAGLPASTHYRFKVVDINSQEFDFSDEFEVIGYDCDSLDLCITQPAFSSDIPEEDHTHTVGLMETICI